MKRIHDRLMEAGYLGCYDAVRRYAGIGVSTMRPQRLWPMSR